MNNFQKWIRKNLLKMGTMTGTAKKIGTTPQQVCKWYQGRNKPNLKSYKRLCTVIAEHRGVDVSVVYVEGLTELDD